VITGANGCIEYNAYKALQNYQLILVDNKAGHDFKNRFGIEQTPQASIAGLQDNIIIIDLASNSGKNEFANLLAREKPDCILHLAAILENQNTVRIKMNDVITRNVMDICSEKQIKLIAASSIMVMLGAAINDPTIQKILFGNQSIEPDYLLSVNDELENTEEAISTLEKEKCEQNLAYIQTKEFLERYAKALVDENPQQTIAVIRFDWTGFKNPYEFEKASKFKGSTFYLA
jgi:nucleoside-diphosphate-sugar epimerase